MTSILSSQPDGCGFYYGFAPDDARQINVKSELGIFCKDGQSFHPLRWTASVGGEPIEGGWASKAEAEAAAIKWIAENPDL